MLRINSLALSMRRKQLGFTVAELERRSGVAKGVIRYMENPLKPPPVELHKKPGSKPYSPTLRTVGALLRVLRLRPEQLLIFEDQMYDHPDDDTPDDFI